MSQLPDGTSGTVDGLVAAGPEVDAGVLRRLAELGFLPGEPVQVLRRGPGGREPIAVTVGDSMFALRLIEAQSVLVQRLPATQAVSDHVDTDA